MLQITFFIQDIALQVIFLLTNEKKIVLLLFSFLEERVCSIRPNC